MVITKRANALAQKLSSDALALTIGRHPDHVESEDSVAFDGFVAGKQLPRGKTDETVVFVSIEHHNRFATPARALLSDLLGAVLPTQLSEPFIDVGPPTGP
jgi:hypothetical protein